MHSTALQSLKLTMDMHILHENQIRWMNTLIMGVGAVGLLFALLPKSICTEMLAFDKSTPELCNACVRVFNNLFNLSIPWCYHLTHLNIQSQYKGLNNCFPFGKRTSGGNYFLRGREKIVPTVIIGCLKNK